MIKVLRSLLANIMKTGIDVNIQARRGNIVLKADRNGNVIISDLNIVINAAKI